MKSMHALLLAALAARAAAADTTVATFEALLPVDFKPAAMAQGDANGTWVAGFLRSETPVLARYRNDGSVALIRAVPGHYRDYTLQLATLADGGVVLAGDDGDNTPCVLNRYDAAGTQRWTTTLPAPKPNSASCGQLSVDGANGVWLQNDSLYRLAADGAIGTQLTSDGVRVMSLLGDPSGSAAYLIGFDGPPGGITHAVIERVSERGELLWKVSPASTPSSQFSVGAAAADGSVYAFGTASADATHAGLFGVKLDISGNVAEKFSQDGANASWFNSAAKPGPDGSAFLVYGDNAGLKLARTGTNGTFAWSVAAPSDCGTYLQLRAAANGDALLACSPDSSGTAHELRVSADGTTRFSRSIEDVASVAVQTLSDSSELSLLQHQPILDANGNLLGGSDALDFFRFDAQGNNAGALQTAGIVALGGEVVASALGPEGSTYLVVDALDGHQHEIARLATDGHIVWRHTLESSAGSQFYASSLNVTASAVCLVTDGGVHCYAIADGTALGSVAFTGVVYPPEGETLARVLDDGSLMVFDTGNPSQLLLSARGDVLHQAQAAYGDTGNINSSGSSLFGSGSQYFRVARDGTAQAPQQLPSASGNIEQAYVADDGSALFYGTTDSASILTHVDAHDSVLWTRTLGDAAPPAPYSRYDRAQRFVVRGAYAYFVLGQDYGYEDVPAVYTYGVQKVALSDGSVVWSAPFVSDGGVFPRALLDASAQHVLLVGASPPNRIRIQALNAASGAVVDDRMDDCGADTCALLAAGLGSDGALRAVVDATNAGDGRFQRVLRHAPPFDSVSTRVDQPGIAGAWYAPYESGQGFSIDWLADAHTVFMPWFTYTRDGGNSPAGLSWYALQGVATNGSHSVDLAITAADPGVFAGGTVGVRAVGAAQLRFADCANGTLAYRFDAGVNEGASGVVSLQRLTPSSQPCVLADGSTSPAQAPLATAQGFEARQSGAWYDPAASGQGLEITVLPSGGGSNGLLFAAWFTFDPSGTADEPTQRHWFTLQGDLASATNGSVALPILRTIGGSFDAQPTGNTVQVGTATLTFSACDTARLDYRFDTSDVAHAFAGLSGSVHLSRIGGCATP